MDKIKSRQFIDRGRSAWQYLIETESGARYKISYDVSNQGHVREILERMHPTYALIWNREMKVGVNWNPLAEDKIQE